MIAGYSGSPSYGVMVVETMLEYNVSAAAEIEDDIAPGAVEGEFEDAGDGNFKVSEAGNYTIKWYFNKVTPKIIVVKNK